MSSGVMIAAGLVVVAGLGFMIWAALKAASDEDDRMHDSAPEEPIDLGAYRNEHDDA